MAMDKGDHNFDGQLVDRVVITIAPMFLQGYNVLATEANAGDAPTTSSSGAKGCVAADPIVGTGTAASWPFAGRAT